MGIMLPRDKEDQRLSVGWSETEGSRKRLPYSLQRERGPTETLILDFKPPER